MPPVTPSYPGVYVEEIPSGSHIITGVPTSITAFVGRTPTGPLDEPKTCFSYADFERFFGGRSETYPLTYAVEDFFLNGGAQAIVVRTFHCDAGAPAANSTAKFAVAGGPPIHAIGPGAWGNALELSFDYAGLRTAGAAGGGWDLTLADATAKEYAPYGVTGADLFNVTVTYSPKGKQAVSERYTAVSVNGDTSPSRIDHAINARSGLVVVNPDRAEKFTDYTGITIAGPGQDVIPIIAAGGKDSGPLAPADFLGREDARTAMYALEKVDLFNLLCIPPDVRADDASDPRGADGSAQDPHVYAEAAEYCAKRRAMLICDPPRTWAQHAKVGSYGAIAAADVGITTEDGSRNSAVYFPFVRKPDVERNGKPGLFAPSGAIAGKFAQTDNTRGVWKAPAGIETGLEGVTALDVIMTDEEDGVLNPLGVNAIRSFPTIGSVIWGARTLRGADVFSDDYKYIPVRRLTLYIEESLYRGTKWALFEPNGETLWSQLRLSIGTFMADLSRQGAFYGYAVTCDKSTTLQTDIDKGIVNVIVAFAPIKPAEFVVLKIAQLAGQTPG